MTAEIPPSAPPGRGRRATLTDVARVAGVSAQTVSNVLNGRTGFSEDTRTRVLAAVTELQFRPNRAAQQLRSKRAKQLGIQIPASALSMKNPFTVAFLGAAIKAAERAGQHLVVFTRDLDEEVLEEELLHTVVDGFVLCNVDPADPRPPLLARAGIPFGLFGRTPAELPQTWVDIDNVDAMARVVDYLVGRGHRRFAYVGYDEPQYWNADRLEGARARLRTYGLEIPDRWLLLGGYEWVRDSVRSQLLGEDRPDAVICASDSLASVVHVAASQQGLRPGTDLAVTGFDGVIQTVPLEPALTTVALPVDLAAEAAVRIVLSQIEGLPVIGQGQMLPTKLILGGSA